MKLDPALLKMACSWSIKAYNEKNADAIKIESAITSTTAFVAKRKTLDIIAFRGTQQLQDWAFNLFPTPVPYVGRLCHGGFTAAHISVWDDIEEHIDYEKRTLICGHSLGGALAELTAAKLNGKHDNLSLITFGKPNVFFKGFKRPMALDNQISVVNGSDSVPRVPRLFYGPSKSQDMLYFSNGGVDYINPSKYLRKKDRGITDRVSDHFMDGYKERLDKFLEDQKNGKTGVDISDT